MKPMGRIELAFETGLIFCFGYGIGDGELQDSFRESLTLRLVVEVHSLLFLASQIQKEHSMDDLLKFLMLLLIRVLLRPSFLRQHKTDLEQYPLAPTSTAKRFTDHPLELFLKQRKQTNIVLLLLQVLVKFPMNVNVYFI